MIAMECVTEKRPRKRTRLTWDVTPLAEEAQPALWNGAAQPRVQYDIERAPPPLTPSVKASHRAASPPWCQDDKDGHYVFELGENLTPRYKILSKMGEGTFGLVLECCDREAREYVAVKVVRSIQKYRGATMIEIDVLNVLSKHDQSSFRCVDIRNWFDFRNHICIVSIKQHFSRSYFKNF